MTGASSLTFLACSSLIIYSCGASLLGKVPDGIPIISERVRRRVPTADMFDEDGNLKNVSGSSQNINGDDKDKDKDKDEK